MDKIKLPNGETLYQEKLASGLMLFILPKKNFQRKYGVLSTRFGSIDSEFIIPSQGKFNVPDGVAHFLEHKLFEEEEGNVFANFANLGAMVNAFTSYTQTSYLFSTIEQFDACLKLLLEFVNKPYLTPENVAKEKGIIAQELMMYQDHPDHRLHANLLNHLYFNNPVKIDIGGTVESVEQIQVEDLLRCYNSFYQPNNLALAIVGDVDLEETLIQIKTNYPTWPNGLEKIERIYPTEPGGVVKDWHEETLEVSKSRYLLGFKHEPKKDGEKLLKDQIIMSLVMRLIAGRSSDVYAKLYNAGLIDDSFGGSFSNDLVYSHTIIGSETDEPEKLHKELTDSINKLKQTKLETSELERLKNQLYGSYLLSLDSFEYTANRFIANYFTQSPYHRFLELLQEIELTDLETTIQEKFDFANSTVSVLRPVSADA